MRAFPRCGLVTATAAAMLLGLASVAVAGDRTSDPIGDAPAASDIVAVTTSINADGELLVEVELADDWPSQPTVFAFLVPNQATYQHVSFGLHPGTCDPYGTGYGIQIAAGKAIFNHHEHERLPAAFRERIYYRVDRSELTITVPLDLLGSPETLGIGLAIPAPEGSGDSFPNGPDGTCNPVSLVPDTAVATPSGSGPLLIRFVAIGLLTMLVAVGFAVRQRLR